MFKAAYCLLAVPREVQGSGKDPGTENNIIIFAIPGHSTITPRRQCNPGAMVYWSGMPQLVPYPPVCVVVEVEVVPFVLVEAVGVTVGELVGPFVVLAFYM